MFLNLCPGLLFEVLIQEYLAKKNTEFKKEIENEISQFLHIIFLFGW